jgi:hypothetical protein
VSLQEMRSRSRKVIEDFLQTVVVLDDDAVLEPLSVVEVVNEPDPGISVSLDSDESPSIPRTSRSLEARVVMESFASRGLVCTILSPGTGTIESEPTILASRRADIVVLDWQNRNDDGVKAKEVIRFLTTSDFELGGRLRLIAIYTAETKLDTVQADIAAQLEGFHESNTDGRYVLQGEHSRIVLFRKSEGAHDASNIPAKDLAEKLIDEYVEMANGLLANMAFAALAAIRSDAHRVLARFHGNLDGQVLAHRLLIGPKSDKEYAIDLIGSELHSILLGRRLSDAHGSDEVFEVFLSALDEKGIQFKLFESNKNTTSIKNLTLEEMLGWLRNGKQANDSLGGKDHLYQRMYILFGDDIETGKSKFMEFSRLSALVRESATCHASFSPKLGLGSVVRSAASGYLVCLQPLCDCVRLKDSTRFLFGRRHVDEAMNNFDLVVQQDGHTVCLKLDDTPSEMRVLSFTPDNPPGEIEAQAEAGSSRLLFRSDDEEGLEWIADMRITHVQRLVHRLTTNLTRIGLDEFEWQRRYSESKQ